MAEPSTPQEEPAAPDYAREREWWNAKAAREEQDRSDEAINRALRWREIERRLDGVRTVLDVGGGTGAFSIPLARRGFRVTHLDLSPAMLELARKNAAGVEGIDFVEGNAADLSPFQDRAFDLVLNLDGAISFCGPEAARAVRESCRVASRRVLLTVAHQAWMVPVWVNASFSLAGDLLPAARAMLERGEWRQDEYPENARLTRGYTQDYLGPLKAFLPGELREILEGAGLRVLRCGGLGSLANLCGPETLQAAQRDAGHMTQLLNLCEEYDRRILPEGPGTRQRAGLIAVAERPAD